MLVVKMSKLRKPEEDLQDPGEAQDWVEAQLLGTEQGSTTQWSSAKSQSACSWSLAWSSAAQSSLTLCNSMDIRLPCSSTTPRACSNSCPSSYPQGPFSSEAAAFHTLGQRSDPQAEPLHVPEASLAADTQPSPWPSPITCWILPKLGSLDQNIEGKTLTCFLTTHSQPPRPSRAKTTNLIKFLLFKYLAKELTSQAEILKKVLRDNQEHFPVVFSQASHCLELVCGVEVKEVDPREHIYIMVPNLGLTCDVMLSSGQSMPKAGLLVLILSLIMQNGDRAPEEKVWGALSRLGVCVGSVHCVFGEPRTLLTHVWVQEGYLEYRQVPYSYPARYEFLWGPRAYAETSKRKVMAFLLRIKERASRAFPPLSAEAAREEDEAA
ncbi:unnamed protein product [Rangifer tarandus platyrhynchus]|uniref:MAGE domain-containing protein n=1 Tax=Rangifer tarandus platyrhynchus TaxID=3082113 RepID=A0ABN9A6C8_RANTA|nr:unnamed protein product [Rangifer tarandus platyrhynchus]